MHKCLMSNRVSYIVTNLAASSLNQTWLLSFDFKVGVLIKQSKIFIFRLIDDFLSQTETSLIRALVFIFLNHLCPFMFKIMKTQKEEKIDAKKAKKLERKRLKEKKRRERKKLRRKKKNALVICRDNKEFWTTQDQFWQWVRDKVIVKVGDNPLRGKMVRQNDEYAVVISNTVLNLAYPNHLREALNSRKYRTT